LPRAETTLVRCSLLTEASSTRNKRTVQSMQIGGPSLTHLFDKDWLIRARGVTDKASWVVDVLADFDNEGESYLTLISSWFDAFPLQPEQKKDLAKRLQSFTDEEHLGAVNELAWWEFMEQAQVRAYPMPTLKKKSTPDFGVCLPSEFFIEVSTLNISRYDKAKFEANESVALDHSETLRRVLGKLTEEKKNQFIYADNLSKPCLLVLFDYTAWSGLGTKFDWFLADFLLGKRQGFKEFPPELSALAYVERKVIKGRSVLSRHRSAIYYNSNAKNVLPPEVFPSFSQFLAMPTSLEYQRLAAALHEDDWIRL
jgi:hypothetical protein